MINWALMASWRLRHTGSPPSLSHQHHRLCSKRRRTQELGCHTKDVRLCLVEWTRCDCTQSTSHLRNRLSIRIRPYFPSRFKIKWGKAIYPYEIIIAIWLSSQIVHIWWDKLCSKVLRNFPSPTWSLNAQNWWLFIKNLTVCIFCESSITVAISTLRYLVKNTVILDLVGQSEHLWSASAISK